MTTSPHHPAGPAALGLTVAADATASDAGLTRAWHTPPDLHGPTGILQGGIATGVIAEAARLVDPIGAPLTSVDVRLFRPTPLGADLAVDVRRTGAARYDVTTRDGDEVLVRGTVELAGHDPAPQVADLVELGRVPLPTPEPQHRFPDCVVCGPEHPDGLHLHPAWHDEGRISIPWIPDDRLAGDDGWLHPLAVAAVLDCPTVWASLHHLDAEGFAGALLAGMHVRTFRDAPVGEPLRVVARFDAGDGRKVRARGALVDEDGVVYAASSCFHLGVTSASLHNVS